MKLVLLFYHAFLHYRLMIALLNLHLERSTCKAALKCLTPLTESIKTDFLSNGRALSVFQLKERLLIDDFQRNASSLNGFKPSLNIF